MHLRTDLPDRASRLAHLAEALDGLYSDPAEAAETVGGRAAALERLRTFDPRPYDQRRNHVIRRGVSALSAYLRHGVLSLAEVRDYVLTRFGNSPGVAKFVNELGWRHFWQLVYAELGDQIQRDLEPPTHRARRTRGLPQGVEQAATGLVCMDAIIGELVTSGYLHNHARMWFAAWLQHWQGIDWRDGAEFFYRHLLDGDPASNSLSWQWVGSTFSHKPYYFNRSNIERFSDGAWCKTCPLANGGCPFDASYEELSQRLFGVSQEALERSAPQSGGPRKGGRR